MDKKQATEIVKHALDALDAIERAGEIVINVDKGARLDLADPIEEVVGRLSYELLPAITGIPTYVLTRSDQPSACIIAGKTSNYATK